MTVYATLLLYALVNPSLIKGGYCCIYIDYKATILDYMCIHVFYILYILIHACDVYYCRTLEGCGQYR